MTAAAPPVALKARITSRYRPNYTLVAGLIVLLIFVILALFPGQIAPYDPLAFDYDALLQPPSAAHLFGTDNFGRDIYSRVIWGARIDLQIAIFTTLFPFFFGCLIGALVGYFGKWLDSIFGLIVNVVIVVPFLVLVIAIVAFLGPGLRNMYIAVSLVRWIAYARLVRGEMLVQKQAEYAMAARVMGYRPLRVVLRHLLPNVIVPAIVFWMTDMSLGILLGASLGYLGLGAQPPAPEWGVMVADGKNFMVTAPWISSFPALALTIAGIGFSLIGDGMADLFEAASMSGYRAVNRELNGQSAGPVLQVRDLRTSFQTQRGPLLAVDGVDFDLYPGEVLGLVGESGSGKSVTLRSLVRLIRPPGITSGSVVWCGRDLFTLGDEDLRQVRGGEISMIFQEPISALNPVITVGDQIRETLREHTNLSKQAIEQQAAELLDLVGIPSARQRLNSYAHQFSGGMRQRVMIAIALASNPQLLLADEPTTALDVTIQDQILKLILRLKDQFGMSVILVTHDLGVVAQTCDRVAVMYAGRLVEVARVADIFHQPRHAYTLGLLNSVPSGGVNRQPLLPIMGSPPNLANLPDGCPFAPRCSYVTQECRLARPALAPIVGERLTACIHHDRLEPPRTVSS